MVNSSSPSPLPLLLLAFIFYLNFFSRIILAPLLPEIEVALSISHGQAGTFFLCLSISYFMSLLASGFISARLGHKRTIVISMVAISLSLLLVSFSPSLFLLQISFFLLGMAAGLYLPSGIATITDLYQTRQLGRAFGVHEIAPNLAFLTAPLFVAWLLPRVDWQQVFLLLGVITTGAAVLYGLFGRGGHLKGAAPNLIRCRALVCLPEFWLMVILFSMGISATIGVYSVLPMFLVSEHGMDEQSANMLVGVSRSTTLVTAFFGGWLGDRFGSLKTMAVVLMFTGLFTALLGLGPEQLLPIWIWLQPLLAVCFFAPAFSALSQIGYPGERNIVISIAIPVAFVLGSGVVPAGITRMADSGHFALGLMLTGGFIAGGSLLIKFLPVRQKDNSCK